MKITVVGTGYVGLVSGVCLAAIGHGVVCVDKNEAKIGALLKGQVPFYEPGLSDLVERMQMEGRLGFELDLASAMKDADVVMIAVGTPSRKEDGLADLTHVYDAVREVSSAIAKRTVIVTKSTVPMGTADEICRLLASSGVGELVSVVSNPEFLREGAAIRDFMEPDRIVIGADDEFGRQTMSELYSSFSKSGTPIFWMSRRAAELTKYAANAFLSLKLTFINEIADLCEQSRVDVRQVADGIGSDKRIGRSFLNAGPGYGGSCFPKDTLALVRTAHDFNSPMRTVETIVALNDQRKRAMARKVVKACGGAIRGKTICMYGLTFKPETDDVRESPAISIAKALQDFGGRVNAYDPQALCIERSGFSDVAIFDDAYAAAKGAHALVVVTDWQEFATLDLPALSQLVATPVLVDLRNLVDSEAAKGAGFKYFGLGRG